MEASSNAAAPGGSVRDLARSPDFEQSRVRRNVIALIVAILLIVALIALVPGLASLRDRLAKGPLARDFTRRKRNRGARRRNRAAAS